MGNKSTVIREIIIENNIDILALTETWLQQDAWDEYVIQNSTPANYVFKHIARKTRGGAWSCIALQQGFSS